MKENTTKESLLYKTEAQNQTPPIACYKDMNT